jgi:hypothetical protein
MMLSLGLVYLRLKIRKSEETARSKRPRLFQILFGRRLTVSPCGCGDIFQIKLHTIPMTRNILSAIS